MTPEERQRLERLEMLFAAIFNGSSAYIKFEKHLALKDAANIALGTTTGTMIGTAATQKLGFFGATPVVQHSALNQPTPPGATYDQTIAQSAVTTTNSIITVLKNLGLTA